MAFQIVWSQTAGEDLRETVKFIALDDPGFCRQPRYLTSRAMSLNCGCLAVLSSSKRAISVLLMRAPSAARRVRAVCRFCSVLDDTALASGRWGHGQSPFWGGQIGPNPTDRGKKGVKRSVLVEADGGPLAVVIAGAKVHDTKRLAETIEAIVVERPEPTPEQPQNLSLDKDYDNPTGWKAVEEHHDQPHLRRIGEEKLDPKRRKRYPARRWVVERTLAWLSKYRAILVRYAKLPSVYLGLIKLACILLWYRRLYRLKGF
jgi:putative transposase